MVTVLLVSAYRAHSIISEASMEKALLWRQKAFEGIRLWMSSPCFSKVTVKSQQITDHKETVDDAEKRKESGRDS